MTTASHRSMTPTEWGLILALAVIWGGSFFFNAIALTALPPFTIVAVRTALGGAFLAVAVLATGSAFPRTRSVWLAFLTMGFFNNVIPFSLIAFGQQSIPSGLASILNATTPIFTVIIAHLFTRDERMTPARVVGVLLGFAGIVVMIGPDALVEATGHVVAELAVLAACVSYAVSAVFARRFSRLGQPPMVTAAGQFAAAALVMVPLALVVDQPWTLPMPGAGVWGALLGLSGLASFVAYILYYRILATAGAVNLMLVTFLIPISAILLGAVLLHERLSLNHYLGMAIVGLGLGAIDGRVFRLFRRVPRPA